MKKQLRNFRSRLALISATQHESQALPFGLAYLFEFVNRDTAVIVLGGLEDCALGIVEFESESVIFSKKHENAHKQLIERIESMGWKVAMVDGLIMRAAQGFLAGAV